jgi:hypothetical protein
MRRFGVFLALPVLASAASAQKAPTARIETSIHKTVNTDTMALTIIGNIVKGDTLVPMSHLRGELASTKKDLQDVVNDYVTLRNYVVKTVDSLSLELKKAKANCPAKNP